ncbi:OX-2 membrane glycoprotein-like isoform X2 [Macrotis lagotis]
MGFSDQEGCAGSASNICQEDYRHCFYVFLLLSFLFFLLNTEGADSTSVTTVQSTYIACLGNNVTLKCHLTSQEEVLQVTWQKVQGSTPKNIGTYSSQYGKRILPQYKDRFYSFTTELKSSMTIYNVTLEDDACYKCLFNVFPNGIREGQMCFSVQDLSELRIGVHFQPTERIFTVICSAVGKPAPNITFSNQSLLMELPKEYTELNLDGIANVTKLFKISKEAVKSLKLQTVSCVMDHPLRKEKKLIPFLQESE